LVSSGMTINFPVLGELSVKEKTTKDLENDIKKLLVDGGYLISPNVTVRLINAKVTILGEVKMPGTFSFTENNISLLQALGLAGDLTINGSREDVVVLRRIDGVQTTERINLTSASFLSGSYQMVKPNDVIVVNPNSAKLKTAGYVGNISAILGITSLLLSSIILLTR
jgi:polysaccharide biosynthesis/export protein